MSRLPPAFDPRTVPALPTDPQAQWVEPAPQRLTAAGLRQLFAQPPHWTPEVRMEKKFSDRPPAEAAVLLPVVMRDQLTLILTQRTWQLNTHAGQIALPGGKRDATDASFTAAALREAHEEIGLLPERVEVLGSLPTYITGTAFTVTPVVGLVPPDMPLQPNPREVADVFEVPLAFLMNPRNHRQHAWTHEGVVRHWYSMPYQDGQHERFIWGATAGMLRNLYCMLVA
ncbi:MAG: hypothetical protein RLZZ352_160 [Pseudomonadota bacterium]